MHDVSTVVWCGSVWSKVSRVERKGLQKQGNKKWRCWVGWWDDDGWCCIAEWVNVGWWNGSYDNYVDDGGATLQGELLRQQLLLRYCGGGGGGGSSGISETVHHQTSNRRETRNRSLTRQGTATSTAAIDCDRGSLQLARAGMTLHAVQVCLSVCLSHSLLMQLAWAGKTEHNVHQSVIFLLHCLATRLNNIYKYL